MLAPVNSELCSESLAEMERERQGETLMGFCKSGISVSSSSCNGRPYFWVFSQKWLLCVCGLYLWEKLVLLGDLIEHLMGLNSWLQITS